MRESVQKYLLIFSISLSMLALGCKRDKCKNVVCTNGTCLEGVCACEPGYFRGDCSEAMNQNLAGNWSLVENCTAGSDFYVVNVSASTDDKAKLLITGLWGKSDTLRATVDQEGFGITVTRQSMGAEQIQGQGTLNTQRDEITFSYNVFNGSNAQAFDQCTATISLN